MTLEEFQITDFKKKYGGIISEESMLHRYSIDMKHDIEEKCVIDFHRAGYIILHFEWNHDIETGGMILTVTIGKVSKREKND